MDMECEFEDQLSMTTSMGTMIYTSIRAKFDNFCRVCGSTNINNLVSIFEDEFNFIDKINKHMEITVRKFIFELK